VNPVAMAIRVWLADLHKVIVLCTGGIFFVYLRLLMVIEIVASNGGTISE
jgi:hypothetical protein